MQVVLNTTSDMATNRVKRKKKEVGCFSVSIWSTHHKSRKAKTNKQKKNMLPSYNPRRYVEQPPFIVTEEYQFIEHWPEVATNRSEMSYPDI